MQTVLMNPKIILPTRICILFSNTTASVLTTNSYLSLEPKKDHQTKFQLQYIFQISFILNWFLFVAYFIKHLSSTDGKRYI